MPLIMETPENINDLVKDANCKHCWTTRLSALNELKKYDCTQSRDVIKRLALHDKVFKVKEEAVRATQLLNIKKDGKPISLGKKNTGYKPKEITKLFLRVKSESKIENFELSEFKDFFKNLDPEMFDVMNFEKRDKFDSWIENMFRGLPNK